MKATKINYKFMVLYPIVVLLLSGCAKEHKNVVTRKAEHKIIIKDIVDGRERLFYTTSGDDSFECLNVGDTVIVAAKYGNNWIYEGSKMFDNHNKRIHIVSRNIESVQQRFYFDSVKNMMANYNPEKQR